MQTANSLVRSIFGFSRCNIKSLVCSVEVAYELMFVREQSRSSIKVTKDIYPEVAKKFGLENYDSVVRQIERLCNKCWDQIQSDDYLLKKFVGNRAQELESSSEVIFLLACYMKYGKPFQEVLEQEPALTF